MSYAAQSTKTEYFIFSASRC